MGTNDDRKPRMPGHLVRLTIGLSLMAFVAAACASDAATDAPSSPAASAPAATPGTAPSPGLSVTPSEAASPTELPTAAPSSSPAATEPLVVKWNAQDINGIGKVESIAGVAKAGDTHVLLAYLPYVDEGFPRSAVWRSSDGTSWTLAKEFPVDVQLNALTAGGPGFVVAGADGDDATVWTSADGSEWQSVSDSSLGGGVISQLITTDSGLIGFGWNSDNYKGAVWTSADGVEWLEATNETGLTVARGLQAVGAFDGRAIAFVSEGDKQPPAVWETTGRAEWTRTGALKDVATIGRVAGGARGWVALDGKRAWTSTDGTSWSKGVPGPDVTSDAIVDDAGFVAVGYVGSLPGETCGDQRPFAGHTWTSADGTTWDRMKVTNEFRDAMVTKLLVVDRTLVGYGQRIKGDAGDSLPVAQWTDGLPPIAKPGDASDEASAFISCGG